jgi:hypothetical protein
MEVVTSMAPASGTMPIGTNGNQASRVVAYIITLAIVSGLAIGIMVPEMIDLPRRDETASGQIYKQLPGLSTLPVVGLLKSARFLLSAEQREMIQKAVSACIVHDDVEQDAEPFAVHLVISTDIYGVARLAQIAPDDPAATAGGPLRAFGERAVRGALAARCSTLPVPQGMLGYAHHINLVVGP